jgi:hypothetical protein
MMRKYRSADAFSDRRQQQLAALEQRLALLDDQLSSVESLIEERFPGLGLSFADLQGSPRRKLLAEPSPEPSPAEPQIRGRKPR